MADCNILTSWSCTKFDAYYVPPTPLPTQPGSTAGTKNVMSRMVVAYTKIGSPMKPKGFAMSFIQAAVRGCVESERAGCNPRQELWDYLTSPLDPAVDNPILWWGVSVVCRDHSEMY
jgi:hypothetical protein